MADPVAYQFWAPQPQQLDTSPLIEGARMAAAGYMAAGQAVGAAAEKAGEQVAKQNAEEAFGETMEALSDDNNYTTIRSSPWRSIPELKDLDEAAAVQYLTGQFEQAGLSHVDAFARAKAATQDVDQKVLKPGAAAKIRGLRYKALKLGTRAGMSPDAMHEALATVTPNSYETDAEAHRAASERFLALVQGSPQESLSAREAAVRGALAREERQQAHLDELERMRLQEALSQGGDVAKFELQQQLQKNAADLDEARAGKDLGRAKELETHKAKLEAAMRELQSGLDTERDRAQEEEHRKTAESVAMIKSGESGFTEAEQKKAEEFLAVEGSAIESGAAYEPVPLSSISALTTQSGLGDFIQQAAGEVLLGRGYGYDFGGGPQRSADISGLQVFIGGDEKVHLVDTTGKVPQPKLDQLAKRLFENEIARDAVVVQQIYGAARQDANDVGSLFSISQRNKMLVHARKIVAMGKKAGMGGAAGAGETKPAASARNIVGGKSEDY